MVVVGVRVSSIVYCVMCVVVCLVRCVCRVLFVVRWLLVVGRWLLRVDCCLLCAILVYDVCCPLRFV